MQIQTPKGPQSPKAHPREGRGFVGKPGLLCAYICLPHKIGNASQTEAWPTRLGMPHRQRHGPSSGPQGWYFGDSLEVA